MALSIKTERADRLARELTALTGETITEAVEASLAERLERTKTSQLRKLAREDGASLAEWVDEWRKGLIAKGYDLERRLTKEEEIELLGDETDLRLLEEERTAKRKSDAA